MTTGRRVAQKRKELGLSQEALGEKLGVSRQSIYKWESDSALPEVEKLVALSRLFGVSVGWLLGVEEEAAPSGGELTAEQLALVEEIAARYAPKPRLSGHRRTVVKLSAVTAAVCLCLVLWGFYRRLEDLTRNDSQLQAAINRVEGGVNIQINEVSSRVEELLRQQNAVTADYGTTLVDADPSVSQAFFQAYAVPKQYVEGMTAEFYTRNGGGYQDPAVRAERKEGQRFTADLRCGLAEDIVVSVAFLYPDGTRQTQVLDRYEGLYGRTFPAVRADYGLGYRPVENGTFVLVMTEGECAAPSGAGKPPGGLIQEQEAGGLGGVHCRAGASRGGDHCPHRGAVEGPGQAPAERRGRRQGLPVAQFPFCAPRGPGGGRGRVPGGRGHGGRVWPHGGPVRRGLRPGRGLEGADQPGRGYLQYGPGGMGA